MNILKYKEEKNNFKQLLNKIIKQRNNKFFMNLKLAIKFIFISIGFKINKISEKERLIQKINILRIILKSVYSESYFKISEGSHLQLMLVEACLETTIQILIKLKSIIIKT